MRCLRHEYQPRDSERDHLYSVGSTARIVDLNWCPCCHRWVVHLRGVMRVRSVEYVRWQPFWEARVELLTESSTQGSHIDAVAAAVRRAVVELSVRKPRCRYACRTLPDVEASDLANDLPGAVANLLIHLKVAKRQALLEMEPLRARLEAALAELHRLFGQVQATRNVYH